MTEARDEVVFRTATSSDVSVLVQLLSAGTLSPEAEGPQDHEGYALALQELDHTGTGEVLVAVFRGEVVGMAQLVYLRHFQHRGGLCAEVESVHVREDVRSLGIGTALMSEVLARAKAKGAYRLQLTSNVTRKSAHLFYERLGFEPSHVGFKITW